MCEEWDDYLHEQKKEYVPRFLPLNNNQHENNEQFWFRNMRNLRNLYIACSLQSVQDKHSK